MRGKKLKSSLELGNVDFAVKKLGYSSLKTEQLEIVMAVLRGRDVFGILPTGYGKTLCFACLPFIFEQILEGEAAIVLIVTPLVAIMKNQVRWDNHIVIDRVLEKFIQPCILGS